MRTTTGTGTLERYVPRMLLGRLAAPRTELVETLEGTTVFADVSGFTRLSERLARKGKEGAEHLVDAINHCFSGLLADVSARGGSLLKFGGDAMLLWFEGDGHTERGCAAAAAMQQTLREVGRIRTGSSHVVLRMSVGVHSGTYPMFLVGSSHRELLVGGAGASAVAEMEALASAGQILLSPDTADLLASECLGAQVGRGTLLARPPVAPPWAAPEDFVEPPDEAIAECLPLIVREHLLGGHAAPEHRTASVAFIQFKGLDELLERDGTAVAARALDELVRAVQGGCERYQVCFLDSDISGDGGKIRLSAGAPRVVGDDEERMLLALRRIVELDLPLPVQVGVNRGPVFTGEVGPSYRRWYVVMGDTVNLAARVMGKAPVGHVYATQEVVRQVEGRFHQELLEPFAVKGKAYPVHASDIGAPVRAGSQAAVRRQLPLVGRDHELELLRQAIADARSGSGALIELVGETGTGKSRLLAEARTLGGDMTLLHTTCEVVTRETPYFAWRDLLRQLLGAEWDDPEARVLARLQDQISRSDPDLLSWLPLIAIAVGLQVPSTTQVNQLAPEARASKLREVVIRFLRGALAVPAIVEVEHTHLMDAASAALFTALAAELKSAPWLVLASRRDEAGGLVLSDEPHTRIELTPLSRENAHALALSSPEASQVPPHVVELAVERSGGSPEFLLDLLAAAAAGDRDELPESIGAATMARIDALDPRDGALVRRAAMLGVNFHPRRLADVLEPDMPLPEDGFWERLSGVFAREPDGHVRFKRPALQEVAYESLPFKLRRQLHLSVGLRLERDQDQELDANPAILSHHFSLAGDQDRAYRYAMAAAKRATDAFSHADAAKLYRRAIDAGRALFSTSDRAALGETWEQLGEALRSSGEPVPAARAFTQARHLLRDDPLAQARLYERQAEVAKRSGALTAAVRWLLRGFRQIDGIAGSEATSSRARMRSNLAGIRVRQGKRTEAIAACREAIAEAESVAELPALAHACYVLDWALVESGRSAEANHSQRALEIYQQLGDAEHEHMVLNNLGMFAYFDGRWGDAVALYQQAGECSDRAGRPADTAYIDCNLGEILSDQGRLDDAEEHLQRARRIWSGTRDGPAVAFIDLLLARLATRRGDYDRALPMLEAATEDLRRYRVDGYVGFGRALIAEAEAVAGDPFKAMESASSELRANDRLRPLLSRVGGLAFARLGDKDAAVRELTHAARAARERDAAYDLAITIDVLDQLGAADSQLREERDAVVKRLNIERLPTPTLAA